MQQIDNHYKADCRSKLEANIKVEIDQYGNWIRKEEYANGELNISIEN